MTRKYQYSRYCMSIIFPSPIDWACEALSPLITAALLLVDWCRRLRCGFPGLFIHSSIYIG